MQESLYEESAINGNNHRNAQKCKIVKILGYFFWVVTLLLLFFFILKSNKFFNLKNNPDLSATESDRVVLDIIYNAFFYGLPIVMLFLGALGTVLVVFSGRFNVSYDYAIVGDELRISKVFNETKRKLVYVIGGKEVLQMGHFQSDTYNRLLRSPDIRVKRMTPNKEAANGKEFFYIYLNRSTEKLMLVLECKEKLLGYMLRITDRTALETDYNS